MTNFQTLLDYHPITTQDSIIIIERVALAKQRDNTLDSVRPSACPLVCLCVLSCLSH